MTYKKAEIKQLFYITHINNLPSILEHGILSHALIKERNIPYTPIYDAEIITRREGRFAPNGRSLVEFANLYFQPRNPMLFRVLHEKEEKDIAVIGVKRAVLGLPGIYIALGNAASDATDILQPEDGLKKIAEIWNVINAEWWNSLDGSKRKIMAESLVPASVPADQIESIYVANHGAAEKVKSMGLSDKLPIIPEPNMFFKPARRIGIAERLFLVEGDMFFSTMQTLTVSVNTVGIMGKGLASRAKYQFPDVYVAYQDACRSKALQMGKPYLYKREAYLDEELADEPGTMLGANANKWFLLFATKRHWRDKSDLAGIKEGLHWIAENYKQENIRSLALPALGCGLGKLDWRDVGPLICRQMEPLDIQVAVYLPREHQIADDHLSAEFLLRGQ